MGWGILDTGSTIAARRLVLGALLVAIGAAPAAAADAGSYAGRLFARSTATGDWGGARDRMAAKGVTLDASVTQVHQGIVAGGKDGTWEYGGRADLVGKLDTGKLGLWPGGFLAVELEGNWGDSVNLDAGSLNPANANQLFPLPAGDNVALPNLSFTQFVNRYVGATVGKIQTVSNSDRNAFAHGKGDTQFMNLAFNINPAALVVPYSTLGVGAIVLPTADPDEAVLSVAVLSATGKASTAGFDDLNGAIYAGEGRVRTRFFDRTGHQLVGALFAHRSYTALDQRIAFQPVRRRLGIVEGNSIRKTTDTWAVYYNFDQLLYETDEGAGRGVGVFGRFGATPGNVNPSQYFFSIGVGGTGVVPGRPLDRFGIGYYYDVVENPTLQTKRLGSFELLRDEWGVEAFYNVALTPWLYVTPDVQVVGPAQKRELRGSLADATIAASHVDAAAILGIRVQVVF